jgi:hypothetical protein
MLYDFFGPLPLPDLETLKNPLEEKILRRATEEDMQTFIETGLLEAANAPELPYSYKKGDANYGRFTKGVAWMTLLKFYMQTKRWADAEAAGRELMKPEYGYDLVPKYKDIFTLANEKNAETIYSFNAMPENRGHSWPAQAVPAGYVANGATIAAGQNALKLAWWFIETYEQGDQRLETIVTEYTNSDGVYIDRANSNGPLREQWGASALKYEVSAETVPDGWWCPIDIIIFRYADALTLLAEAIVRKGGAVTDEAVQLLNRVRTRAGLTGYTLGDFSSSRVFLDKLLIERAHELFYECGTRRQDLIRDGSYVTAMEKKCQQAGENSLIGMLGDNAVHFPLPQWVIDSGKGLIEQNPGY